MMNHAIRSSMLVGLAFGLGVLFMSGPRAEAFSTGGHFTATRRGLEQRGFGEAAIRAVQAGNFAVDHWSQALSKALVGSDQQTQNVSLYFHFDQLDGAAEIELSFARFWASITSVVTDAVARHDVATIVDVLGIASHAIEDFYSHANFADIDWQAWKGSRYPLFADLPPEVGESALLTTRWNAATDTKGLLTGSSGDSLYGETFPAHYPPHGDGNTMCEAGWSIERCGVDHDSTARRGHLVALVMATESMVDLSDRVQAIVNNPTVWREVTAFNGGGGVDAAWDRAQAESAGAGEWGGGGVKSNVQVVLAYAWANWVDDDALDTWQSHWRQTLFALWKAAPAKRVPGGVGVNPFPPASTPIFTLPPAPPVSLPPLVGSYTVTWGEKHGLLTLAMNQGALTGVLSIEGARYTVDPVAPHGGGLDVRAWAASGNLTGRIFATGTAAARGFSGYLRDAVTGVPDGFAASALPSLAVDPSTVPARPIVRNR